MNYNILSLLYIALALRIGLTSESFEDVFSWFLSKKAKPLDIFMPLTTPIVVSQAIQKKYALGL